MAKTTYQKAAMSHVKDYLDRMLKMETIVGKNIEKQKSEMAEKTFSHY